MKHQIALVTGASRGIGRSCSIALARVGFDVAIAARTVRDGDQFEHSPTATASDVSPLPGTLTDTAARIKAAGTHALVVPMDLLSRESVERAIDAVFDAFGRIDVVVNNGRYVGPGDADRFMDTSIDLMAAHFQANVLSPALIIQRVLGQMRGAGQVRVIQISSSTGQRDPDRPAGQGGWSVSYAMSKAAFHRIVGILVVEHDAADVLAFNVLPGFTLTERMANDLGALGFTGAEPWISPDVTGDVVAWMADSPNAARLNGQTIIAREFDRAAFDD